MIKQKHTQTVHDYATHYVFSIQSDNNRFIGRYVRIDKPYILKRTLM